VNGRCELWFDWLISRFLENEAFQWSVTKFELISSNWFETIINQIHTDSAWTSHIKLASNCSQDVRWMLQKFEIDQLNNAFEWQSWNCHILIWIHSLNGLSGWNLIGIQFHHQIKFSFYWSIIVQLERSLRPCNLCHIQDRHINMMPDVWLMSYCWTNHPS
jgi:hypothetical protein